MLVFNLIYNIIIYNYISYLGYQALWHTLIMLKGIRGYAPIKQRIH